MINVCRRNYQEEKELFKLLFMRDRTGEKIPSTDEELTAIIELIHKSTGMTMEKATEFHIQMWIFVHGIATMYATNYLPWDLEYVSNSLTNIYLALMAHYRKETSE